MMMMMMMLVVAGRHLLGLSLGGAAMTCRLPVVVDGRRLVDNDAAGRLGRGAHCGGGVGSRRGRGSQLDGGTAAVQEHRGIDDSTHR